MKPLRFASLALVSIAFVLPTAVLSQGPVMSPGKWEITTTVTSVDMPGASPAMAKQMNQMLAGRATTVTSCVTPDQASKAELSQLPKDCSWTSKSASGGRISTVMTCKRPGGTMTVSATGTYSATTYQVDSKVTMTGANAMNQTQKAVGKRVGTC